MSAITGNSFALVMGGQPRVDLLPPEVRQQASGRKLHRVLVVGVIAIFILVVIVSVLAGMLAGQAQQQLTMSQAETQSLLSQQARYSSVRVVQTNVNTVKAAQQVGAASEIDWKTYLGAVLAATPTGVQLTTLTIDSADPIDTYAQPTAPLQGGRVATVVIGGSSTDVPPVGEWLDSIAKIPGYSDASSGQIKGGPGAYSVNVTVHLNEDAYDNRFSAPKGK